jgi:hypothetical protein
MVVRVFAVVYVPLTLNQNDEEMENMMLMKGNRERINTVMV